jgi:hypothetical protein
MSLVGCFRVMILVQVPVKGREGNKEGNTDQVLNHFYLLVKITKVCTDLICPTELINSAMVLFFADVYSFICVQLKALPLCRSLRRRL